MEQRRGRRKLVRMHAVIRYERLGLISGQTKDIGAGGMALQAGPVVVPVHSPVRLHFKLPTDGEDLTCDIGAEVAWTRNGAMGMAFLEMAPETAQALERLVSSPRSRVMFRKRFNG